MLHGFALWSVASHVTVLLGGGLYHLVALGVVLMIAGLVVPWLWQRRGRDRTSTSDLPMAGEAPLRSRFTGQDLLVVIVTIAAMAVTLCAHRPDPDDSLYVSFSVAAADDPSAPILHRLTLHSISEPRFFLPNYKLHSLEMLVATVAVATGVEPIAIFHLMLAPLAAGLCIMAHAALFRRLTPGRHGQAVLAVFVFLVAMADTHQTIGNFAFVRLHQGKGILVSVMVPVLILVGLAFARRPGKREWLDLCAAQIAAIGLTANGLLVGPVVAGLAVLSGLLVARQPIAGLRALGLALAASAYPVAAGVLVSSRLRYVFNTALAEIEPSSPLTENAWFIVDKAVFVFGSGPFAWLCLVLALAGWCLADGGEARSLGLVFPLGIILFFLNPLLVPIVARYLVSGELYWRVFWTLPVAVLAGTAVVGPLRWGRSRAGRLLIRTAYGATLMLILLVMPQATTLSRANGTRLGAPDLKVPPEFEVALAIREHCPEHSNVLAPEDVSLWITTLSRHPYPLLSRSLYGYSLAQEYPIRAMATALVSGHEVPGRAWDVLLEELSRMDVRCVAFAEDEDRLAGMPDLLSRAGYHRQVSLQGYVIWSTSNTTEK
jgi:hypothetical protein